MRAAWTCVLVALLALGLVPGTTGCGSGGAVVVVPPGALFTGPYFLLAFLGDDDTPDEGRAIWGDFSADGAGGMSFGAASSNANGVTASGGGGAGLYTLDASGVLEWQTPSALPFYRGGLSSDGAVCGLTSVSAPLPPLLVLGLRRGGTFDAASLAGTWHAVGFSYDHGALLDVSWWGTVDFDGAGTGTASRTTNTAGGIAGPAMNAGAYVVAPDGTLHYTHFGAPLQGGILAGGGLAVLTGTTTAGGWPTLLILVRAATAATAATLTGTYHAVGMEAPNAGVPEWRSYLTTAAADGAGSITIHTGLSNSDGMVAAQPGGTTTYGVAANGALTVAGGTQVGGVSASGRFAAFAGGTGAGNAPNVWFLLR